MYEVSIATWCTKADPGARCTPSENSSALAQPITLARNELSKLSSKDTLAAQWITWVRLRRSAGPAEEVQVTAMEDKPA